MNPQEALSSLLEAFSRTPKNPEEEKEKRAVVEERLIRLQFTISHSANTPLPIIDSYDF
jgi:hypothetical protein